MIKETIKILVEGRDLSEEQMTGAMRDIMEGNATDAQIGAFLTALRMKGETVEEITGAAKVMREKVTGIKAPANTVDTCGTGGDMSHTFNISTTTALVVAACGVPVAKHGNRSVSSSCGSADVLEALGIKIDLEPGKVEKCLEQTGFGFMFAPLFHPAMKFAIGPRKEMGIRTVFNILGPLTNPAGAERQVLGVFNDKLTEPMARVLANLGVKHAFVVHGEDGLDEITNTDRTRVTELKNGNITTYFISPEDFNFKKAGKDALKGGDARENAVAVIEILKGERGPRRDIVLMNAAAALVTGDKAKDFGEAVSLASKAIDSGAALDKLEKVKKVSNSL
ncbi:MAG: anthranilate phosphoribosyltransferase [Nitrospiraceae bacterium]|nr:MAG: anthranilate phosphoribosyltransferase [Nitrospiraceae bacterium]